MNEYNSIKDYRIKEKDYAETVRLCITEGSDIAYEYLSKRLGEALDALLQKIDKALDASK